jgi:hypothetical protein
MAVLVDLLKLIVYPEMQLSGRIKRTVPVPCLRHLTSFMLQLPMLYA